MTHFPRLKTLTVTALALGVCFVAASASAGTQMPPWKKAQLKAQADAYKAPPVTVIEIDDDPYDGGDNGDTTGGSTPVYVPDAGSNGGSAAAAPTPSAVAGGLALMGLLAGRRRKATA
ncbi:MAG: hypothetical protein AAF800_03085 [Planctomycetota bacterium]